MLTAQRSSPTDVRVIVLLQLEDFVEAERGLELLGHLD